MQKIQLVIRDPVGVIETHQRITSALDTRSEFLDACPALAFDVESWPERIRLENSQSALRASKAREWRYLACTQVLHGRRHEEDVDVGSRIPESVQERAAHVARVSVSGAQRV